MEQVDVIIVGGGPAGSSCAWRLRHHGVDCLILDKEDFPRTKLCAGWITPEVVSDLEIDSARYPYSFLTFESLRIHLYGLSFPFPTPQHSIRRYELDDWLLKRCGAPVLQHTVKEIRVEDGGYVIDDQFRCRFLVGAGGTRCPVYRSLFRQANPRARELQIVTLEHELPYDWQDEHCHLWFFDRGLPGYSWYVPKGNGHLNLGVGAVANGLKRRGEDIKSHWERFRRIRLEGRGLVQNARLDPKGYSYYLRGQVDIPRIGNAFVVGDSAGLASRDLGEGIGPAVRSGMIAARTISGGEPYDLSEVNRHSLPPMFKGMFNRRRSRRLMSTPS